MEWSFIPSGKRCCFDLFTAKAHFLSGFTLFYFRGESRWWSLMTVNKNTKFVNGQKNSEQFSIDFASKIHLESIFRTPLVSSGSSRKEQIWAPLLRLYNARSLRCLKRRQNLVPDPNKQDIQGELISCFRRSDMEIKGAFILITSFHWILSWWPYNR